MTYGADFGRIARDAILAELAVTPKPGLVDLESRGAHADLCLGRMTASAYALEPAFAEIALTAAGELPSLALREELGEIGRRAERRMLRATGGANAHRGAIWALGLLVAARASFACAAPEPRAVARRAGAIARLPDRFSAREATHGSSVRRLHGAGGAVAEARSGFVRVSEVALPLVRRGVPSTDIVLALLLNVVDTCVLYRGGPAALAAARFGAARALAAGGTATREGKALVRRLDAELVARNVSPGGCADLLAAGLFLNAVTS